MNENRKDQAIPLISFLIIQIIFIIILVSMVIIFRKDNKISDGDYERQPSITIENLSSELPNTFTGYIGLIERVLANTVELNTETFNANDKALIRKDTLKIQQFDKMEGYYYSVIVDIPNLQQSYQIYDQYPTNDSPPNSTPSNMRYVLCLDDKSEIVYPDFDCKDEYDIDLRPTIAAEYLKYFDFTGFTTVIDTDSKTVFINLANSSDSNIVQDGYIKQVKQAIDSLGISPDLFSYKINKLEEVNYESYIVER